MAEEKAWQMEIIHNKTRIIFMFEILYRSPDHSVQLRPCNGSAKQKQRLDANRDGQKYGRKVKMTERSPVARDKVN